MDRLSEKWIYIGLGLISYIILSANIGGIDIYGFDEARNAYCAREMQKAGEWIIPSFNGELRTFKPPLHYWFMIVGYKVFGYGGFGARIFSVLFGVATVLFCYKFTKEFTSKTLAWIASTILLASIHFSIQVHQSVPDPFLIFFVTAGAFYLFKGSETKSNFLKLTGYILLGLGILSKGPVALVLPGFAIFMYLIFFKKFNWSGIKSFSPFWGVPLAILVAFPWYYLVNIQTAGEFTQSFFLEHNLGRFTKPMEGHRGTPLLTLGYILLGMLPFSICMPAAILTVFKQRKEVPAFIAFCFCMLMSVMIFFMISSTKLINYTTPCYPFLAIVCAYFIKRLYDQGKTKALNIYLIIYTVIGILLLVGAIIGMQYEASVSHLVLESVFIALLPISGLFSLYFLRKLNFPSAFLSICIGSALAGMVFFHWLAPKLDEVNPYNVISPHMTENYPVVGFRLFNPSFISIGDTNILAYDNIGDLREYFESNPKKHYVLTQKRFLNEFVHLPYELISEQKDLFERPTSVLVVVGNED